MTGRPETDSPEPREPPEPRGSHGPRGGKLPAARLEELPAESVGPAGADGAAGSGRATSLARRVRAGLLVDLGFAPREGVARWQQRVRSGEFDPDGCADELLEAPVGAEIEAHLAARAGTLLRDFLMSSQTRGLAGKRRAVRGAARTGAAMFLTHVLTLGIYTLLIAGALLVLRARGTSLDGLLDNLLGWLPDLGRK